MQSGLGIGIGTFCSWIVIFVLVGGLYGCPQYNVYTSQKAGEAQLAQAQSNREIAVREAQAKNDAADLLAQAEVKRAQGVAKANQIIGDSLKDNEAYLRYLWIDKLDQKGQVIYVPTEAGLPILEAGKRQ